MATETLERGLSRSPLIRDLVTELEASDLIVHIEMTWSLPSGVRGTTQLATVAGGNRYVRIMLRSESLLDERTAILGHELYHACEIARSSAATAEEMRGLYGAIGRAVTDTKNIFETQAAIDAGLRVWFELHGPAAMPRSSKIQ